MNEILIAVIPVVIIGIVCAAVLVTASKLMAVKEDERFPAVRDCLPGANCGACGFAGCDGYAKALSEVLGVEFEDVVEQVAVVRCSGDCEHTQDKVQYVGIQSCKAAKLFYGGKGSCTYGCLGLGDCAEACPQNAIFIKDGVAQVYTCDCIGCGICAKACPNHLISLVPDVKKTVVACSNRDKGAATRKVCSSGCIGCRKCERVCPSGAIKVKDNVAVIDYEKCTDCGSCAAACTTGCIRTEDLSGCHHFTS